MKKMRFLTTLFAGLMLVASLASCEKEEDTTGVNEEEGTTGVNGNYPANLTGYWLPVDLNQGGDSYIQIGETRNGVADFSVHIQDAPVDLMTGTITYNSQTGAGTVTFNEATTSALSRYQVVVVVTIQAKGQDLITVSSAINGERPESADFKRVRQGGQTDVVDAFFPVGYNRNNVVAWYTAIEYQTDGQVNVQAIYILNDGTMISTVYKKKANGTIRRELDAIGTCQLTSGDWNNGTAIVEIPQNNMELEITIVNGQFSAMGITFTKQDNTKVPTPQEPTGNGGSGGTNSGELQSEAYLPADYADKTVAAWYAFSNVENDRIKTEAVFLFTDGTMVVTQSKERTRSGEYEKEVLFEGTYQLTGNYENGTVSATGGGMIVNASIVNGVLSAMNSQYTKQDNADAPTQNNGNENGGNENGGNIDPSNATAYFPASFAARRTLAAWYTSTDEGFDYVTIEALFLFTDNTLVFTSKTYNDNGNIEKEIEASGTYTISNGDLSNGSIEITADNQTVTLHIVAGVLSFMDYTYYTKQENSAVPAQE